MGGWGRGRWINGLVGVERGGDFESDEEREGNVVLV